MAIRKTKTTTATKKNPWRSTHVPLPSWIMFWALVLCTMALIVVNFSKAFAPAPVEAIDDTTVAQFVAIRASLEQQVNDLQAQIPSSESDERSLVKNASKVTCGLSWNASTSTQTIAFTEPRTRIQMNLPYSFDWGNNRYALTLGDLGDPSNPPEVDFGPAVEHNEQYGCYITRDSSIEIKDTGASPSEVRKSLKPLVVRERTVGGVTVLSYTNPQDATWPQRWEVFGRTHTYTLASHGWLTDADAIKIIQSLKVVK